MDLREYQESARSTAIYGKARVSNMIYPALGIVGECGEVVDKIKKMIRDDNCEITEDRKNGIEKELGDCFWYLANICCETNHDLSMMRAMRITSEFQRMRNIPLPRIALSLSHYASLLAASLEDWHYNKDGRTNYRDNYTDIPHHISSIIVCIEEIARRFDLTIKDICETNILKLTERKRKGTLKGDGDDR